MESDSDPVRTSTDATSGDEAISQAALSDAQVAALLRPDAYPHDASARQGIEHIETHISHLFLTGERVYKFHKAVALGFLDFGRRAARDADSLREVSLNRRLARDVYLGVAPLLVVEGEARIGAVAESLDEGGDPGAAGQAGARATAGRPEHCVVMRRLAAGTDAQTQLRAGLLDRARIEALASRLARFHAAHRLPRAERPDEAGLLRRVAKPGEDNLVALADHVEASRLRRLDGLRRARLARAAVWLERRRRLGLLVDGHGDLRLEHVWFESDASPVVIDCLEFDAALRQTDPANDLGFFVMDLLREGAERESREFLQHYLFESDDYSAVALLDHFVANAACVRAKVAGIAGASDEGHSLDDMLELAIRVLEDRPPATLFLMCGVVGSGKSSVARALAEASGGSIIASDRVRKRYAELFGIAADEQYRDEWKDAVYAGLLPRAEPVAEARRSVILDATYSKAAHRAAVLDWAAERDLPVVIVEARCARETTLERLARRRAEGRDPSDAGPEQYAASVADFEPVVRARSSEVHWIVDTGAKNWRMELAARFVAERPA